MDFSEFQRQVSVWASHNFPNAKQHEPLLGLTEEVGELAHSHLKMEQGIRGNVDEHKMKAADAIGDIAVFLAHYCHLNGYSLHGCIEAAWNEVKDRDWINYPKTGRRPVNIMEIE